MTCQDIEPSLSAWLDDELEPDEAQAVGEHLRTCDACRRRSDALRNARQVFRILAPAIAAEARPRDPRRYYAPVVALAVCVTTLVLLARTPAGPRLGMPLPPAASATLSTGGATALPEPLLIPGLDCHVNDPGPSCEIEIPPGPCSSALECGPLTP